MLSNVTTFAFDDAISGISLQKFHGDVSKLWQVRVYEGICQFSIEIVRCRHVRCRPVASLQIADLSPGFKNWSSCMKQLYVCSW